MAILQIGDRADRSPSGSLLVRDEALGLNEGAGSEVVGAAAVVIVYDGMNHDGLLMDRQDRVCRHIDPVL
jgi:hypothetical protein